MRKYIIGGAVGIVAITIVLTAALTQGLSGIPDAINSYNFSGDLHLSVIANERNIQDKTALAKEIIDMCRNNDFQTIKFSYDMGYPESLSISVYETRGDFEERMILFNLSYESDDNSQLYNIVQNPERYKLYLDGNVIAYDADQN